MEDKINDRIKLRILTKTSLKIILIIKDKYGKPLVVETKILKRLTIL